MAPFCPQRHERQAQHRYQQQQRRRREEEERQRHAEHHARRERDASGREEARAEGSGLDPAAPEKASAKAKGSGAAGGHGPERPKRPGSLLAPNNVMKLKQIDPSNLPDLDPEPALLDRRHFKRSLDSRIPQAQMF